jgi:HK97 gp10 family phage protein
MLTLNFDLAALEKQFDNIEKAVAESIRPAAQAGAQVFYDEVRARAPRSEKLHFTKGKKKSYAPGNLQSAIYQAFNEQGSTPGKSAEYAISWNKQKAFYGRFVEFGTKRMPAYPFLRTAYDAVSQKAIKAVNDRLEQELKAKL